MFVSWPISGHPGSWVLLAGDGRRQFLERLHLPDSVAKECDLAELALSNLFRVDRVPRQCPDRELDRAAW